MRRRRGGAAGAGPAGAALPGWLWPLACLGIGLIVLPLAGMATAVDWSDFGALVTSESSLTALGLSLRTSALSTLVAIAVGTPVALVLARGTFPALRLVRALVLLPLVLPPVVGGIALLYTFGRRGLIGSHLEVLGIHIAFTTTAVVLAQAFVATPFLIIGLEGALRSAGHRYEEVAATLGARPSTVLMRITLPLVLPGLISGSVLAFARSLGEFGATLTFAGSLQGVTRTLPLEIYLQREIDPDAAVALSMLLVAVAALIVVTVYGSGAAPGWRRSGAVASPRDAEVQR